MSGLLACACLHVKQYIFSKYISTHRQSWLGFNYNYNKIVAPHYLMSTPTKCNRCNSSLNFLLFPKIYCCVNMKKQLIN